MSLKELETKAETIKEPLILIEFRSSNEKTMLDSSFV